MPKINKPAEEVYEEEEDGEDDNQFEDEDGDEDELEKGSVPLEIRRKKVGFKKPTTPEPKRRFGVVAPQPIRLIDVETNEVVGEGDYLVTTALADIIERLERIENSIGSMLEG